MSSHFSVNSPNILTLPLPANLSHATILLVEDDAHIRRHLELLLHRAGYDVVAVANGIEAIKAALSSNIHAVITGSSMPHLNGHELCRLLRSQPTLSHLPIIFLTAMNENSAPQERNQYADAHLTKPFNSDELVNCLACLLNPID